MAKVGQELDGTDGPFNRRANLGLTLRSHSNAAGFAEPYAQVSALYNLLLCDIAVK